MHIPVEILAQIVRHFQVSNTFEALLALRLVSGIFNMEILRVLPETDQIHPRDMDKLLELGRIPLSPQSITERLGRYRKRQMTITCSLPRKRPAEVDRSRHDRREDPRLDDEDVANNIASANVARSLPLSLLQPYLMARMEDSDVRPCLLSTFIDKSIDLILEHKSDCTALERQELFMKMVTALDAKLIGRRFAEDIFSALFDYHGLKYWLPLYETASLIVYPDAESNLRLFHLFRLIRRSSQLQNYDAGAIQQSVIRDLLAFPPKTPEYARIFTIEAFNLVMNSKTKHLLGAFLASETGILLAGLTVPENIWCAAKHNMGDPTVISLMKALISHDTQIAGNGDSVQVMLLVIQGLVESGQSTHLGRTVIAELVQLKSVKGVIELCRDLDLEDCTEIWHRAHAADLMI